MRWDTKTQVQKVLASKGIQGALDEKKSKAKRTPKQYEWHAHHPWPKFMGGEEKQPKMGVRSYVHISLVHPMLTAYLKGKGYKVAVNQGPDFDMNRKFIQKMKANQAFKAKVMDDLLRFHSNLNLMTNPKVPMKAYSLGIEYTFKYLK